MAVRVLAGMAGASATLLTRLLLVPVYLRLLGVESFGLIGLYATLNAVSAVMDAGLSTAINREIAQLSNQPGQESESRDVVRSLELVYIGVGIAVALALGVNATWFATHWLHVKTLSLPTVTLALVVMFFNFAMQWPDSLYSGALLGLHGHVPLNRIKIVVSITQGVVTVALLWFWSPSIITFFVCSAAASLSQTLLLRRSVWTRLPSAGAKARFRTDIWRRMWRFAAGTAAVGILGTILTQLDKLVLTKLLPLDQFGLYALAVSTASATFALAGPVVTAAFPELSRLAAKKDEEACSQFYHRTCQTQALLVVPLAALAFAFAPDILTLYFRDAKVAAGVSTVYRIFLIGSALNALMAPAFSLQMAYGWTGLSAWKNVCAVAIYVPLLIVVVPRFGAIGTASMWLAVNFGYVLFEIPLMHRKILPGAKQMFEWYAFDMLLPVAISASVAWVVWQGAPIAGAPIVRTLFGIGGGALALVGCALALPQIHRAVRSQLARSFAVLRQ